MSEIQSRAPDAPEPSPAARDDRQVTMFNRKAVVVLAGIAAMTVMVVSFAFNAPGPSQSGTDELVPAEQVGADAARRNYLTSPPDTARLTEPGAGAPTPLPPVDATADLYGSGAMGSIPLESAPDYGTYGTGAYAAPTSIPAAPVTPPAPSARELSFQRAMRCGIRSCDDGGAAAAGGSGAWAEPASASPVGAGAAPAGETGTRDRHAAFLQAAAGPRAAAPAASQVQRPASPYQIMAGTIIPATLVTGINSDLPGEVVAQVTRNVYDTQQRHLLIPAGSKVLGKVDNQVGLGQARVNIAWHRIIFPNNASLALPGFGGVDGQGAAGIRDRVNNHYGRTYLNALLLSAITAGAQLSQPQGGGVFAQPSPGQVAAGALGQQMGEVSSEAIRRNMQVGPTLEVRPGFRFSIFVSRDLVLEPYDHGGAR